MKRFNFSLQALQLLRERQEQMALHEYSKALKAWEQARGKAENLQRELEAAWGELKGRTARGGPIGDLARLQAHSQAVEQRKQAADYVAKVTRNKASQAFTKLLAARQARAVVEKFFEKQKRRHDLERRRHEQHKLDEMSSQRQVLTGLAAGKRESLWS